MQLRLWPLWAVTGAVLAQMPQVVQPAPVPMTFGTVTASAPFNGGQLGGYVGIPVSNHSAKPFWVGWTVTGTPPTQCAWLFEVSTDGAAWGALGGPMSCLATGSVMWNPQPFTKLMRLRITGYTAGDGTTAVSFIYTPGAA